MPPLSPPWNKRLGDLQNSDSPPPNRTTISRKPLGIHKASTSSGVPPMSVFSVVDDKRIPLYRVVWIAATPHFVGGKEDCLREGYYEIRLEQGESVWANTKERDRLIQSIQAWHDGSAIDDDGDW